jgi:hypothetical protein
MNKVTWGLDVSTSWIGFSIIDEDGKLTVSDVIKLNPKNTYEKRIDQLEEYFMKNRNRHLMPSRVFVERPLSAVSRQMIATVGKLNRFNGMVCYFLYQYLNTMIQAELIDPRSARAKFGLNVPMKAAKDKKEKKKVIIDFVQEQYPEFTYDVTPKGNPKPGTDDRADAVVINMAGRKIFNTDSVA